ncbi:hypothetical protein P3L10_016099 [Capsicum annuum]|uniref:uncharacterized protein LOC107869139 n=1 Tax=Capsicum annuum TaxID=4072 RepID=UPI001FB14CB4|nr:uncharacterized protein LOC107869139 [Capsicum annuum]
MDVIEIHEAQFLDDRCDLCCNAAYLDDYTIILAGPSDVQRLQARYDGYGALCYNPKFVGGVDMMLYFRGAKETDFAIFSNDNLHINAHLIGTQTHGRKCKFTRVQTFLGMFASHTLLLGAKKVSNCDENVHAARYSGTVRQLMSQRMEMQNRVFNTAERSVVVKRTDDLNNIKVTVSTVLQLNVKLVPICERKLCFTTISYHQKMFLLLI